ncbi:MAG: hypothetical protein M3Z15_06715 [Pseudomonadota bacterium]|nr:hypothetical protein [Pseudomonadota bacterium]
MAIGLTVLGLAAWWLFGVRSPDGHRSLPNAPTELSRSARSARLEPMPRSPASSVTAPDGRVAQGAAPRVTSGEAPRAPASSSALATPLTVATPSSFEAASSATGTPPGRVASIPPLAAGPAPSAMPRSDALAQPQADPYATPPASGDHDAVARALLRERMPLVAERAERQLGSVLALAANTRELNARASVRTVAQAARAATPAEPIDVRINNRVARSLNERALVAFWRNNNVPEALGLQMQAFGANPFDAEIIGNLAFLRLRESPPQAESARQLALHALTVRDARFPTGRIEDWTALAVASALTGRDTEAANAWFVSMALTNDLERQCNAAIHAHAIFGERLRPSVQAMLQRAHSWAPHGRCENTSAGEGRASGRRARGAAGEATPALARM